MTTGTDKDANASTTTRKTTTAKKTIAAKKKTTATKKAAAEKAAEDTPATISEVGEVPVAETPKAEEKSPVVLDETLSLTDEDAEKKLTVTERFIRWCHEDTEAARFQRSIVQGIIGVVITVVPQVCTGWYLPEWATAAIVAAIMSILAPIQKAIGNNYDEIIKLYE